MHVEEEDEQDAVELLLKCLYKAELRKEDRRNIGLILQVYRLADKYEIPAACMEPILAALSAVEAKDIDLNLLSVVYSLPPGLREHPDLKNLVAACRQTLVFASGVWRPFRDRG